MSANKRTICAYDPAADLEERHPLWRVEETQLHGMGEVFDVALRLILIDPARRGTEYAWAHVLAHLDLGHVNAGGGGSFSQQQEADAHWLALMKLDRADDRS